MTDTSPLEHNCPTCHKLILVPGVAYGINPNAVCKCVNSQNGTNATSPYKDGKTGDNGYLDEGTQKALDDHNYKQVLTPVEHNKEDPLRDAVKAKLILAKGLDVDELYGHFQVKYLTTLDKDLDDIMQLIERYTERERLQAQKEIVDRINTAKLTLHHTVYDEINDCKAELETALKETS